MVRYKDKAYRGEHEGIVDKKKFKKVQALLEENQRERGRIEKNNHQYLLKGKVRCGSCESFMTPKSAKSGKYFYYSCTVNERFGKNHCSIRRVSAPALERANRISKENIEYLEKEKVIKERELQQIEETIRRFIESLKDGTKTLKLIEDELEKLEREKDELEKEINLLRIQIEERKRYAVDGRVLKNYLDEFDFLFDRLKPVDQQRLLQILLREVVFYGDKIKISLWDLPHTGLSLQEVLYTDWFANSQIWLPEDGTERTHFDFYIIPKSRLIFDRKLHRNRKIDLSQVKFELV